MKHSREMYTGMFLMRRGH